MTCKKQKNLPPSNTKEKIRDLTTLRVSSMNGSGVRKWIKNVYQYLEADPILLNLDLGIYHFTK